MALWVMSWDQASRAREVLLVDHRLLSWDECEAQTGARPERHKALGSPGRVAAIALDREEESRETQASRRVTA